MKHRSWISGSFAMLFLVAAIVASYVTSNVQAATTSDIRNISNDGASSLRPKVAQDPDGNAHVVWASQEGSTIVRYAKGVFNGSNYDFGGSVEIANVGGFGFSTPNVGVSPDGTVLVSWSPNFGSTLVKAFNMRSSPPGSVSAALDLGIRSSIAADANNRFHIVADRDQLINYCEFDGSRCVRRETLTSDTEKSAFPDVAVDSSNNVHVVWDIGQVAKYRARAAGGNFGSTQDLGGGNAPQVAPDGQGNVHIVWSGNFDIQYCARRLGTGCFNRTSFDVANDVQPSVGATPSGSVVVGFAASNVIYYTALENGRWSAPSQLRGGATVDVSARGYVNRLSLVFSGGFEIQHVAITVAGAAPTPTPCPSSPSTPAQPLTGQYRIFLPLVFKSPC